ncbi:MAG: phage late control D family protein [Egibacteraceae bacterium]
MAEPLLYAATAPVVRVDGTRQPDLARDLLRLDVEETTEGLRTLALHVVASVTRDRPNPDVVEYLDAAALDFGKRLEVSLGPPGNERIVFAGAVSALEVSFEEGDVPHVTALAEDELMTLRMTQRSATYTKMSDAGVARVIAGKHGLKPEIAAGGPTYDVVQQINQSDLAFLRDRGRLIQAELWALDGALHFATRDRRRGTAVTLTRGSELLAVSARADLAHQCTSVSVSGFDAGRRDRIDASAPASTITAETSGGRTGPQTLRRAFGDLPGRRVRDVPLAEAEASAFARAEMLRRARGFVTVRGTTNGTPELVVGSRVSLARCGRPFDGPGYYVTRIHHTYDLGRGFRTHFDAERPTVNEN